MYKKLYNKFLQMIRQAYYSVVSDDTSEYPQAQVTSNGKATNITRLSTYGVFGNPPLGAHVLMFQSQGQESTKFAIFNDMTGRKKGVKEGECGLFNTLTEAIVYLKEDGSIAIESNVSVDVQAPVINAVASASIKAEAPVIDVEGTTVNVLGSAAINIEAPAITLKGAVVVDGAIGGVASGPLSAPNGVIIGGLDLGTHIHGGVTTGLGNTGGPV